MEKKMKTLKRTLIVLIMMSLVCSATVAFGQSDTQPISLIVILDVSSSMGKDLENLKVELYEVVHCLKPGDEISVLTTYRQNIREWASTTITGTPGETKSLNSKISKIRLRRGGGTDFAVALEDANMVVQSKDSGRRVVIAILTDGRISSKDVSRIKFFARLWKSSGHIAWVTGSRRSHRDLLATAGDGNFRWALLAQFDLTSAIDRKRIATTQRVLNKRPGAVEEHVKQTEEKGRSSARINIYNPNIKITTKTKESDKTTPTKPKTVTPETRVKKKSSIKIWHLLLGTFVVAALVAVVLWIKDAYQNSDIFGDDDELGPVQENLQIVHKMQPFNYGPMKNIAPITIGSSSDNSICIAEEGVDSTHLQIKRSGRGLNIKNVSSDVVTVDGEELLPGKRMHFEPPTMVIFGKSSTIDIALVSDESASWEQDMSNPDLEPVT
jgi:von Willebrand factor type A domain